jgi:hypothetical protein
MPYDTLRAITDAEMIALNALQPCKRLLRGTEHKSDHEELGATYLLEPRKMHPKMITRTVVKYSAFNGKSRVGWTLAKKSGCWQPAVSAK